MAYKRPAAVGCLWEMVGVLARGALFTSMPASFSSTSIRAEAAPASFLPWPDARICRIQREAEFGGESWTRPHFHAQATSLPSSYCLQPVKFFMLISSDRTCLLVKDYVFPQHAQQAYSSSDWTSRRPAPRPKALGLR